MLALLPVCMAGAYAIYCEFPRKRVEYYPSGAMKPVQQYKRTWRGAWVREGQATWWHENGTKELEFSRVSGRAHGKVISWYDNGQVAREYETFHGVWNGRWVEWTRAGQKYCEGQYLDGEKHGTWRTYVLEGLPALVEEWEHGVKVSSTLEPPK